MSEGSFASVVQRREALFCGRSCQVMGFASIELKANKRRAVTSRWEAMWKKLFCVCWKFRKKRLGLEVF